VKVDAGALEGLRARCIGSAAMSGRVAALDGYRANPAHAVRGRGGRRTVEVARRRRHVQPVFDKYNQSIGAITISPRDTNTMWVGTGEPWTRKQRVDRRRRVQEHDGGENWQNMGLAASERVSRIAIDPRNQDVVFVGALGGLWSDNPDRGVYRTKDGGKTWDKVLFVDAGTGCADLAIDPKTPTWCYAAMWQYRRRPWRSRRRPRQRALPQHRWRHHLGRRWAAGCRPGVMGRIAVAIAPSQPTRIYAVVETRNTALLAFGTTRARPGTEMNSGAGVGARPFYFCALKVDPKNPDRVYKQGYSLSVSDDGGKTFGGTGQSYHGDTHDLWIDPTDTDRLVLATDGAPTCRTTAAPPGASWARCRSRSSTT